MNEIEYKGHHGSVEYSQEDALFHGQLLHIRALVTCEGADAEGLQSAFKEAMDDYLALCQAEVHKPDVPSLPADKICYNPLAIIPANTNARSTI